MARDLLNQHSAWLNTFRSQMNLNGTTVVMTAGVRCWGVAASYACAETCESLVN